MAKILYDNDFIVGGSANSRLTPNFKVKEFFDRRGKIRIHRELVAVLQILRDRIGTAITIKQLEPASSLNPAAKGRCIVIGNADAGGLAKAGRELKRDKYVSRVAEANADLYLEIPDSPAMPPIKPETAFDCGMQVTAAYETSGDPYQQVTGNFDGAGLSFGPIQCNLGTGTLQELFRRFRGENEALLRACFADNDPDYRAFWTVLDGSRAKAARWADGLSTGGSKHGFSQPWKGYLQAVGREDMFRKAMRRYAYDKYGKVLLSTLSFMKGISPVQVNNLRCLAALYDMGVQQGGFEKARSEIITRVFNEQPTDEFALTRIVLEERAKKANQRWRADCLSRRLGILDREPVRVSLNGHVSRRTNPRVYLLRNSPVGDVDAFLGESSDKVG
jgi:hypothetical protein